MEYHHRIVAAVESCTPVTAVLSIIKQAIYTQVGEMLHGSIGIGPNRFLAKTASNMQKPDGLTVIRQAELPERLYGLRLADLNGIGRAICVGRD